VYAHWSRLWGGGWLNVTRRGHQRVVFVVTVQREHVASWARDTVAVIKVSGIDESTADQLKDLRRRPLIQDRRHDVSNDRLSLNVNVLTLTIISSS
jgi:hypothetical protein